MHFFFRVGARFAFLAGESRSSMQDSPSSLAVVVVVNKVEIVDDSLVVVGSFIVDGLVVVLG